MRGTRAHATAKQRVFVGPVGAVLCLCLVLLGLGCEPYFPPDYYVINPRIAFDNQGDLFVAYQVNESYGVTTYLQKLTPDGDRLWGPQGIRVDERQPEPQTQLEGNTGTGFKNVRDVKFDIVPDPQGNVTVFWTYEDQLLARKVDGSGHPLWGDGAPGGGHLRQMA